MRGRSGRCVRAAAAGVVLARAGRAPVRRCAQAGRRRVACAQARRQRPPRGGGGAERRGAGGLGADRRAPLGVCVWAGDGGLRRRACFARAERALMAPGAGSLPRAAARARAAAAAHNRVHAGVAPLRCARRRGLTRRAAPCAVCGDRRRRVRDPRRGAYAAQQLPVRARGARAGQL